MGFFGERTLARLLEPTMRFLPGIWAWLSAEAVAGTIAFILITFMLVILGELVPKAIALQGPDRVALLMTRPLLLFSAVMRPFIVFMSFVGNGVVRMLGFQPLERPADGAFGGRAVATD